jgi:hypothetical protein
MIKVLYLDVIVEKFRFVIIVFSLTHRLCVDIFHNAISNIFLRQKGLFSDRLLAGFDAVRPAIHHYSKPQGILAKANKNSPGLPTSS